LSILAALKREGPRDSDIDLASFTCLVQETAILTAKRAAQGKVGRLSIGFIGSATLSFLPDLIRRYKLEYPNVKLALHDLYPVEVAQMSQFHLIGTPYQSDWNIRRIAMSLPKSICVTVLSHFTFLSRPGNTGEYL
jgi:hypothetical protein